MAEKKSKSNYKSKKDPRLARAGVSGYNKPKMTPSHPKKKAIVVARENGKVKTIRFGAKGYGHNYSPKARKSYLARSGGIKGKDSKLSANYWARKFLWGGPSARKKSPPKGKGKK